MTNETHAAFKQLHAAAMKPGTLDLKTKELIALACGVVSLCEGCVQHHARAARQAGVTEQEIQEMVDVCVLMGGGPASTYGRKAVDFFKAV
ncbi:MAG: carboxymuconolactone decarboxylase family protein [Phycisphaerae bacterium]|nr:carboxymuconolactone decarboxylase family protein [Phycisphaerae bacterium]